MATLDTLYFDLKINDLTDAQIKALKAKLERDLGTSLDIGKNLEKSLNNANIKVKIGADTSVLESSIRRMNELINKGDLTSKERSELVALNKIVKDFSETSRKSANDAAKAQEKLAAEARKTASEVAKAQEKSIAEEQKLAKETERASSLKERQLQREADAMIRLRALIDSLGLSMRRYEAVSGYMGKPATVEAAIQKMREYMTLAREAAKTGPEALAFLRGNTLSMGASNIEKAISVETQLEKQRQMARAASEAQEKLAASHYRASIATDSHARASIRLGQSMTGLISITGDLRNQIGMLVSAYTIEHMLKNVVQIGGEFEKQKLAMGSMLGSLEHADDIFNRIKNLALTSPFNFKDLATYSRQLAAYGTPYKDLYDTTNRLADISAGLGGDMSRLVLAFSQVKAAAFLRGQEMRQFTEFGVALPEMLAKKYSEAEHRIVTAGDVIERVSKRMVSFNDVKDVLWKSTDKGGQFFGMQNVLAQSTAGMASNLKDAIDTMYYDIANSNSTVIKGTIKDITVLVGHWRELASVLAAGTILYTAHRLAMAAHNRVLGLNTAGTLKGVMAAKQEEVSLLRRKALYGQLTAEESMMIASSTKLNATDLKNLATSRAINANDVVRMVNLGKITAAQALSLGTILELSVGQRKYLFELQRLDIELMKSSTLWDKWVINLQRASMKGAGIISGIGMSIKSALGGILTKGNLLMAGAFLGLDVLMDSQQSSSRNAENNRQTIKNAEDGVKTISEFLTSNPIKIAIDTKDTESIDKLIESYKEQLSSQPIDMSAFISNTDTISNTSEKLKVLRAELESLKNANENIAKNGNPFLQSQSSTEGGFFNTMMQKLKGWNQAIGDFLGNNGFISENFRLLMTSGSEMGQSLDAILLDVSKNADNLNQEFYKLSSNDIQIKIENLKKQFPEMAVGLESMRKAGASNLEVMNAMARIDFIKGTNFSGADGSKINEYMIAYNSMIQKFTNLSNDAMQRYNASMDRVDVEGHTEKWKLGWIKNRDEIAKTLNLQGDDLKAWNFITEETINKNSAKIQDHPQVWRDMYEGIKLILSKNGVDIKNATQKQVNDAFKIYKAETEQTKPYLAGFLATMNQFTANHPIYLWSEFRMIGKDPSMTLTGNGKSLSGHLQLRKWFTTDDFAAMTDDAKQTEAFTNKLKDLQDKATNAAKTRDKNTKKYQQDVAQYKSDTTPFFDWAYDETHTKNGNLKNQKQGTDEYLKSMNDKLDQVKKVMDVYKKWKETGIGEKAAIGNMDSSGIFAQGTFKNITSEKGLNEWYKNTLANLTNLMKASTPERKKYKESIAELIGDYDRKATKDKLDDMGKRIEKDLDESMKKWDIFKKVKDATGSEQLAAQLAFGGFMKNPDRLSSIRNDFGKESLAKGLNFDSFLKMTDSDLTKYGLEPLKKYREKYLEEDGKINQETADRLLDLINKNKDYAAQILAIRTKLEEDIKDIDKKQGEYQAGGVDTEKLKQGLRTTANRNISKLIFDQFKENTDWATIFGDLDAVSNRTLGNMVDKIKSLKDSGGLAVDEIKALEEALKKINDENIKRNPIQGFINSLNEMRKWSNLKQRMGNSDSVTDFSWDAKSGNIKSTTYTSAQVDNGLAESMNNMEKSVMDVISSLQSLVGIIDQVSGMFDKLGMGGLSNLTSVLSGTLNGATGMAGSLKGIGNLFGGKDGALFGVSQKMLGIYGAAAGAAVGLIGSIAEAHDKRLDKAIEKSKLKVQELNNAYNAIEIGLKYYLGDASTGFNYTNNQIDSYKSAQALIASYAGKGMTEAGLAEYTGAVNSLHSNVGFNQLGNLQNAYSIINNYKKSGLNLTKQEAEALQQAYNTVKNTTEADKKFAESGNAYNYQRDLYQEQLQELEKQRDAEARKKNTDKSKILDYDNQILEMQAKVSEYSENLAKELYGIDIKGWASQLGDALFEAWQKGEDGAEAFKKKVDEIMASVVNKLLVKKIIEPAFQNLVDNMMGKDGQSGWFSTNNTMSVDDILNHLAPDLQNVQTSIGTYNEALNSINLALKKSGYDIKNTTSGSNTASAIGSVTEQEANIIAAYMDSIHQDTYNNRMNLQRIVDEGLKVSSPIMEAQLQQMMMIESNTYKNMEMVSEIRTLFNDITLGNKKIYVH